MFVSDQLKEVQKKKNKITNVFTKQIKSNKKNNNAVACMDKSCFSLTRINYSIYNIRNVFVTFTSMSCFILNKILGYSKND